MLFVYAYAMKTPTKSVFLYQNQLSSVKSKNMAIYYSEALSTDKANVSLHVSNGVYVAHRRAVGA